jgi:salicylate 5-hydroxylase large subunit
VPYWVYSDPEVYAEEQRRVFQGASWCYAGLAAEVPNPGDFKRTFVGDTPVVLVRDEDGELRCVVNRCAHRGVQFCRQPSGSAQEFICPYHQWTYDLKGNLMAVPFRRGVNRMGGMPADFALDEHGLQTLTVTARHGVVFVSFDPAMAPFEDYLGPTMLEYFDRVFDGRELRVLGYMRQLTPANWKLMFENIKDPYHASLLHVFLVTFGLFRADNPSAVKMDATGMHSCLISMRGEQKASEATAEMKSLRADLQLNDARLIQLVREFPGTATVVMQTLWPNLVIQQQTNTLATRQIVPRGPEAFELVWTFFGYAGDSEEMTQHRLLQANLMGPSGFVSIDDSEVMRFSQEGVSSAAEAAGVLEMGGRDSANTDHMVTEAAIRAFYEHYRHVMDL